MTELDRIKALLRDDLYPDSKDWSEGSTLERVEWLLTMYQGHLEEAGDGQPDEAQEWHDYDPDC